jgi:hypothetical protein
MEWVVDKPWKLALVILTGVILYNYPKWRWIW